MTLIQPMEFEYNNKPIKKQCCPLCGKEIEVSHTPSYKGLYCSKCGYCSMESTPKKSLLSG